MARNVQLLVFEAAKTIRNDDIAIVGTGLPTLAAYLAQQTTAPDAVLLYESGVIGATPRDLPIGVGDFPLQHNSVAILGLVDVMSMVHGGRVTLGFLGGAQVDRHGNINSTRISISDGRFKWLTGSGGANDIASSAGRTVIIVKQERRRFVEQVDYCTTPGHTWQGSTRHQHSLRGAGPVAVITDMAVFGFTAEGRLEVRLLHPGVSREDLLEHMSFEPEWSPDLATTPPPPPDILAKIGDLDPGHVYIY